MARTEDVIALVHDLSSAGLAVTLIGAPARNSEDTTSSERSKSNSPTRIDAVEEQQNSTDDSAKKTTHRYSRMAEEIRPTRDSELLQKRLNKKIDVRYLNEIKSFKEKIKSSYLLSCNQKQCPVIQERLNQHQHDHHPNLRKADYSCSTQMRSRDQAINVSPTLSRMRLPKFTLPLTDEGRQVQTEITMKDFSPNRFFSPKVVNKLTNEIMDKGIPLKKSETREVLPRVNFYKEHLQNEILKWIQNVPMFYTLNFTTRDIKDNIVNSLAERINALAGEVFEMNYEIKTKIEIENCLSRLPMWLHGSKRDQILFKDGLKEKLWNKIQGLNEKFLGIKYEKAVSYQDIVKTKTDETYEKEIAEWSEKIHLNPENTMSKRNVIDLVMKRLSPLLKIPLHTTSYKLILKGEIIDILDDLPLTLKSPRYKTVHLNKFAEELANRLLSVQIKRESSPKNTGKDATVYQQYAGQVLGLPVPQREQTLKNIILERIGECLDKVPVCHRNDLKTEICSSFLDSTDNLRTGDEYSIRNEICQFLLDTGKISKDKSLAVAKMIIKEVKDALKDVRNSATTSFDSVMPQLSGAISVYRWGTGKFPITSTPKKQSKKEIPKLNPEETAYMEKVAGLIRTWMDTLPKQYNEDKNFKETIIKDLAGDLMDYHKVGQLAPETFADKDKYQKYIMYRWLYKFNFYDDDKIRDAAKPVIGDFLNTLKEVPVPKLTAPQHGTRQAMENIKHMEGEFGWDEDYVPKGVDVLEDQISVWMNEQPSEIYSTKDKDKRDKMVHDLALKLQDHLRNKSPESAMDEDIDQWLKKVVKTKEKEHIGLLSQNLKEKVKNIPQDQTLQARHEERKRDIAAKLAAKRQMKKQGAYPEQAAQDVSNIGNIEGDPDRTIREFIAKFIEHNYDIDDPLAIGAFSHLLKTELRKLSAPTRKEVYDNFEQSKTHEKFMPDNLTNELEYIKIISDWLNNIPIEASYNTPGNKNRIEFVNDLARNIEEIEEQRSHNPTAMEYNYLTASMILQSMHSYALPILPEHKDNTPLMVEQLLQKLNDKRPLTRFGNEPSHHSSQGMSTSTSLNVSDIKEQNMSEFITDYVRVNGMELADDELKLEAWTARLLKEIKKMINDGADPKTLTKAQVYEKFAEVPVPTDESVRRYCLEIAYVKEITNWMNNIPLLPIFNQPPTEEEKIRMISELAEKICDREELVRSDPNNETADKQLEDYIATWISRLPLDRGKDIDVPMLVQQLMSRIDKVDTKQQNSSKAFDENEPPTHSDVSKTDSAESNQIKDKETKKSKRGSKDKCPLFRRKSKTPAEIIVEAIENWSHKLPIKGDDKEAIKSMKEGIARKLYQKTGELNVDPRIFNDDVLYRDMLGDEIDTHLENVPQNPDLQKNREKLKEGLLNTIIDTNKIIKEKATGENYKHKLETTIDASIPNPVQSTQAFDPGFEIYKNHLANMFIIENFDHANDDVKANYEKRIRQVIDKYFESAQNRNALPLSKDQIYNELYSALFKVPMPNENSVIDEVEQVKTRCEIDAWYEDLPMQQTDDINELLERDKILSTLAKRIHEIEKSDSKADKKIRKEISKWLEKLPLSPGHEGIDVYAKKLQALLKSTAESRKYVPPEPKTTKSKSKLALNFFFKDKKDTKDPNTSQIAGPSNVLQSKSTNAKPCLLVSPMAKKKPGDLIVEAVEEWCNQIPLISTEENNKAIRDNISTRIIIRISELNMDSEIFNDDVVYDELLDDELENVMSNLPVCCDFEKSKPARKYQLKEIIKSIKPLIKEEKARHEYKEELNSTVASILKEPQDTSAEKLAQFNKLKDEIVENFVQYNYNKNDEEGKQLYKKLVHDGVVKYCIEIRDKGKDDQVDPLVRRNQLLAELGRIPVPQTALKEEVEEIKMKKEVEQFFRDVSIPEGDDENKMKRNLAKRLCDIEKSGHTPANHNKMKSDVTRCLRKLNKEVSPQEIDAFINKLKDNEAERKSPPMTDSQAGHLNQSLPDPPICTGIKICKGLKITMAPKNPPGVQKTSQTPEQCHKTICAKNHCQVQPDQWVSLPESAPDSSYGNSLGYENFEQGNLLSSTLAPQGYNVPGQINLSGSLGPQAYGQPSRKTMNKCLAQGQRSSMRQVTSGPMLSRPSYNQISTPRQVAQSPQITSTPCRNVTTPGNATPNSLFQVPVFKPVPLHRPLPVPIVEPVRLPGSTASMHAPRRQYTSAEGAIVPSGRPQPTVTPPLFGGRTRGFDISEQEICRCERCPRIGCRGLPFCMLAMDEYFDDCIGIPVVCGMHLPECFYY